MAEITRKRCGELVRGVFQVLLDEPDGLHSKVVFQRMEEIVPPTEFEDSTYPNHPNERRYENIIRFSTISSVKAGWLLKSKGTWTLTEEGKAAYQKYKDPETLYREVRRLYKQWKAEQPDDEEVLEPDDSSPGSTTLEEAEESSWAEIEEHLGQMPPYDFQELVAGLLKGMGYFVEWVSPPGPDKGIDILAHTDPLGVKGPRIKVQVKRRADKVNSEGVRGFMAVLGDSDVGLFVNTGGFTKDAEEEARRQERRRIMLVDLKRLFDLWIEHYERIPEDKRRLLPLRPVYYLAPDE